MNKLLVALCMVSLTACITNTESSVDDDSNPNSGLPVESFWIGDKGPVDCNQQSFVHVQYNGHDFWVQVPTMCDRIPYVFRGDPGPDFGNPIDNNNSIMTNEGLITKEDVLGVFHDRIIEASRTNQSAFIR